MIIESGGAARSHGLRFLCRSAAAFRYSRPTTMFEALLNANDIVSHHVVGSGRASGQSVSAINVMGFGNVADLLSSVRGIAETELFDPVPCAIAIWQFGDLRRNDLHRRHDVPLCQIAAWVASVDPLPVDLDGDGIETISREGASFAELAANDNFVDTQDAREVS